MVAAPELRRLHRLPRVRDQVAMREDRTERTSGHRRGVDDRALLVAAGFVSVALQFEAEVRAEVDPRGATVRADDGRGGRRLVEERVHGPGREALGQAADREHRTDAGVRELVRDLRLGGERIHEHRATSLACRERDEELRRRGHEDRGATPGGTFAFRGVIKPMFTRNGFNVYPREIERVIGELPGVRGVRAFGVPDAASEHEVAVEVTGEVTEAEVKAWAETRLSVYKRPTRITIVAAP